MEEKDKFRFNYSAPTEKVRREAENIRDFYADKDDGDVKFQELKRLNSKVKNGATRWGIVFGVVGVLVFGLGMSMILEWGLLLFGSAVSIVGAVFMGCATPVYNKALENNKQKYGEKILLLSKEILEEE